LSLSGDPNRPGGTLARGRREQELWDEHAAFMDELVDDGVVDEEEIRDRLAPDPWANGILQIDSVRPWTVWLRAAAEPR
jgi:hypothetical protein